jgi:beta-mannosidase
MRSDSIGKEQDKNEKGRGFQIIINGKKILALGGNWVPCDPFPSKETPEKLEMLVERAAEMGVNMLRVWGGGHFESREFYDACDRYGIMTTLDFMMACGTYPEEEEWFIDELKKEAEFAVKLVRNHPCFMWYSGDNENGTNGSDFSESYKGRRAAYEASAPAVYSLDPFRQFLPSSPYGGNVYMSRTVGTMHNTTYLGDYFDYFNNTNCENYKEFLERFMGRFIAEEPVFTMANKKTLLHFMTEDDVADPSEVMLEHHTQNNPALKKSIYYSMTSFAKKIMGASDAPDTRLFEYKYLGYEWTRVVMENMRRHIGFCNGMIFWMYNDCWPASMSWSFVDYYGMPKASFYAFRRLARPCTSSVTCENGEYKITLSNFTGDLVKSTFHAYFMKKSNNFAVVEEKEFELEVGAYSANSLSLGHSFDPDIVAVCDVDFGTYVDRCFYSYDRLFIEDSSENIEIVDSSCDSVTIRAKSYIHAIELEGEYIFSDNYFSLLKDEEKTVTWKQIDQNGEVGIYAYTLK